ncbi:MAG: response regulator transcription factor [Ruminococcaceae bacterium]|nr:response regulator transcription factor [Oscillospiraceae bacterium]
MYKILVVDDEEKIRELIGKYAKFEGHSVDFATDGMEAVEKCRENAYDIIIMDIMMPNLDGFSACREIRKKSDVPILMLSARGEEYDKINGFELGVDDYVVKPFSPKELMLRVEAIMKRARQSETSSDVDIYKSRGLEVNFTARRVYVDGVEVNLSPKEYDLLFYMIKNKDIALTREKLINKVWGYDFFGGDRTLDTHIKLLRKSLGDYASYIITLRSVGYRYSDE